MSTAAALAVVLPSAGLVIAVVIAMWRGMTGRLDEHGRRLDKIDLQLGDILRALGRLEGRREAEVEAAARS